MSDFSETLWDADEHTYAKHEILSRYLDAWLGILGQTRNRIVYVDGFAGPGEYPDGRPGSPVIAIERAMSHVLVDQFKASIHFVFIEKRKDRKENLERVLDERFSKKGLRSKGIDYVIIQGEFADFFSGLLDDVERKERRIVPTFAFLDPFGYSGIPMELIGRFMKYPGCEVLITFMAGFVNRFADDDHAESMNEVFYTSGWREVARCRTPDERKSFWKELYQGQLRTAGGASLVKSFEMINKHNQTAYYLVYGTNHWRGLEVMKEAMCKIDPRGTYQFSDTTRPGQSYLCEFEKEDETWAAEARALVWDNFRGQTTTEEEIHIFIVTETPYLYLKKPILWVLEDEGKIINRPRKHSYSKKHRMIELAK